MRGAFAEGPTVAAATSATTPIWFSHLVFATSTMVGSACRTIPDARLEDFACKSIGGKDACAYTSRAIRSSYVSRRVVTRASPSFTNTTAGRGWPL